MRKSPSQIFEERSQKKISLLSETTSTKPQRERIKRKPKKQESIGLSKMKISERKSVSHFIRAAGRRGVTNVINQLMRTHFDSEEEDDTEDGPKNRMILSNSIKTLSNWNPRTIRSIYRTRTSGTTTSWPSRATKKPKKS